MAEWWEEAFREDYLRVYPHRDEIAAVVDCKMAQVLVPGLRPGRRVLDLACGAGRHLRAMRKAGVRAVGADFSSDLLAEARRAGEECLIRCDMRRLPFRDGAFDAVTMFFNSFGYFPTEEEDAAVLHEVSRLLVSGGGLLLDLPWPPGVRRGLVPRSQRIREGLEIVEERSLAEDGRIIRKRVTLRRGSEVRSWTESLRLYPRSEILRMARDAGLRERRSTRVREERDGERPAVRRMLLAFVKAAA